MKSKENASRPVGVGLALMTSILGTVYFFKVFRPVLKNRNRRAGDRDLTASERLAAIRRQYRREKES